MVVLFFIKNDAQQSQPTPHLQSQPHLPQQCTTTNSVITWNAIDVDKRREREGRMKKTKEREGRREKVWEEWR